MDVRSREILKPPAEDFAAARLLRAWPLGALVSRLHGVVLTQRERGDEAEKSGAEVWKQPRWTLLTFILFVALPSLIAQVYLAFVAADQYVAEARFAVRTPETGSVGDNLQMAISSIGSGAFGASATSQWQYAYVVCSYIRSRPMVDALSEVVNLRDIYRRPGTDFWARLRRNATTEELVDYWTSMTACYVDSLSGIVKLEIRAFTRDDAVALSNAVLARSELLVNDLSTRARADAMRLSEQEVRRADERVRAALLELRRYRDSEGLIDPVKTADETGKIIGQLLAEKIRVGSDLFVAERSLSPDAPTVQNLRHRLESIDAQITEFKLKLTGTDPKARNVAGALLRYEQIEIERQFAEKLYTIARGGLENARAQANRQSVYLTVFVPPSQPEEARYPRRIAASIVIPVILLILWGIGALVVASVEDHRI